MAYNEALANRIREALLKIPNLPRVEEKKMFGGLAFMVDGKMCVGASWTDQLLFRIDPSKSDEALKRKGAKPMVMRGKPMAGYVYVNDEGLKDDFDYWLNLALEYNRHAKASKKKK